MEQAFNIVLSQQEPHCSVCSFFSKSEVRKVFFGTKLRLGTQCNDQHEAIVWTAVRCLLSKTFVRYTMIRVNISYFHLEEWYSFVSVAFSSVWLIALFSNPCAWFSMCISNTKHQSKISCASKQLHFPTLVRGTSRMFPLNASLACFAAQQQKLTSHLCFISQDNLLVHLRENLHKPLSNLTINLTGLTEKLSVPKVPEICFMSDDSSPESMSSWLDKKFTTDTASPLLRCASCKLLVHASE